MKKAQQLKDQIVNQKLQVVEITRAGIVISSENNIVPFEINELIKERHVFFDGLVSMMEAIQEPVHFPCINLEIGVKSVIVDIDIIPEEDRLFIIIFDFTQHYTHSHPLIQEKNEASIEKHKLLFDKQLLLAKEEFKNKFLSHLNHEIRNPLNNLLGFMEILESTKLDYDQQQAMGVMKKTGVHLKVLMDDMLDISQIERGAVTIKHVNFNLYKVLKNLENHFNLKFKKSPIQLVFDIQEKVPTKLIGDPIRLNQILFNLLENAFRNTEQGSIQLTVSVQKQDTTASEVSLLFDVTDTGVGISAHKVQHIFQSYYQLEYEEIEPIGQGVGLKIVKDLTSLLGGNVSVNSIENKGTSFKVSLPFETRENSSKRKSVPKGSGIVLSKRILIIEDEEVSQMLFMKTFLNNDKGYYIEIAQNASHAFELLEKKKYEIVLLKASIADMSGIEFIERLRSKKNSNYHTIPLLMVSGNTMKTQQAAYLKAGANLFLAKPYTKKELFNSLEKLF